MNNEEELKRVQCPRCNWLLFKASEKAKGEIECKCVHCKNVVKVDLKS